MGYKYEREKPELFTEDGFKLLMKLRDEAKRLIAEAGVARADKIMTGATGSSWTMLAALDYMVECGDLRRVTARDDTAGQHQVFSGG